jgi:hypothetical protein
MCFHGLFVLVFVRSGFGFPLASPGAKPFCPRATRGRSAVTRIGSVSTGNDADASRWPKDVIRLALSQSPFGDNQERKFVESSESQLAEGRMVGTLSTVSLASALAGKEFWDAVERVPSGSGFAPEDFFDMREDFRVVPSKAIPWSLAVTRFSVD